MNERINELMFEAFQSHYGDPITTGAREKAVELVSGWGEKFAELLIQKCADIGERYADGNYEVRNQILSHFGLEEE